MTPRPSSPPNSALEKTVFGVGLAVAVTVGLVAYRVDGSHGEFAQIDPAARRIYDPANGRLVLVIFDSNGNLKFDTWSYMEGERLLRMESDDNEDGTIDRREYYGPGEKLERVEYLSPDGRVDRTEFYDQGVPARTAIGTIP